jgi:hypothetical protein
VNIAQANATDSIHDDAFRISCRLTANQNHFALADVERIAFWHSLFHQLVGNGSDDE